jgi:restriction system protein
MHTNKGTVDVHHSARGIASYSIELWHEGLNKHRLIKGADEHVVFRKAEIQADEWDARWEIVSAHNEQREWKAERKAEIEENKAEAATRTNDALEELAQIRDLLKHALTVNDAVDWSRLKNLVPFQEPPPVRPSPPRRPELPSFPIEPMATDFCFKPKLGLLEYIFPSRRKRQAESVAARLIEARSNWQQEKLLYEAKVVEIENTHEKSMRTHEQRHLLAIAAWTECKAKYETQQQAENEAVEAQRLAYLSGEAEAIVEYCDMVLSNSEYPDGFPQEFEFEYIPAQKSLIVNYTLPSPDDMPKLKSVKYIASREAFEEQHQSEAQANKQYDDAVYQICLRTLHELFEADVIRALDSIALNGIVNSIDRRTGKDVVACILSVHVLRDEFLSVNLAQIEAKACFKSLKGVGSSKLHGLSPIPPVMTISRDDARFVPSYGVAAQLDSGSNLAAMNWEDFEHLIRELFEKEFTISGGEVKVTQASRDGGVDAVAFDPDIRGGKIVIQAKRYTNTVGVSAVRDLYGTVMNEGANKGILVTTSDYGPDSYDFAKGKPLVLLNGANLLHMLQKHGFNARINIQEARKEAALG